VTATTLAADVPGPALVRDLRRIDLVALTVNNVIGAGVFTMPSALAAGAGRASLAVLLLTILLTSMMALCLVEVASRFDRTGGPMIYASEAFGQRAGFIVGWLMYLSRLSAFGAVAVVMLDYGAGLWPALAAPTVRLAVVTLVVAGLAAINIRGVSQGARMSSALAAAKVVPLVLVAGAGIWMAGALPAAPPPERLGDLGSAVLVAFFACMGFETVTVLAGEVRDPQKDLPAGILGGICGVAIVYTLLMIACLRAVPDLAHATRPLAAAAAAALGPGGAVVVSITAVLSCAGTLTVMMLTTPRVLFALAEHGDVPPVLASVNPIRHTPAVAIVVSAAALWLLTVSGTFVYLATFSAMARLLMYGSTCAALIVLRRRAGPAPVTIPWGPVFSVLSMLLATAAIVATAGTQIRDLTIAVALGWALRAVVRYRQRAAPAAA
jgi:basic amino acid/polyamine antiporter, APA family